jgi:hypothetical protein
MTEALFQLSFLVTAPFWALMIVAPGWALTRRIAGSPLIVLAPLAICLVVLVPILGDVWPVVTRPTLTGLRGLLATPEGVTALWAQVIAWDLFVGRWMYLDSRRRDVHPLVMAPLLLLTILLSPIGLPVYFVVRLVLSRADRVPDQGLDNGSGHGLDRVDGPDRGSGVGRRTAFVRRGGVHRKGAVGRTGAVHRAAGAAGGGTASTTA